MPALLELWRRFLWEEPPADVETRDVDPAIERLRSIGLLSGAPRGEDVQRILEAMERIKADKSGESILRSSDAI